MAVEAFDKNPSRLSSSKGGKVTTRKTLVGRLRLTPCLKFEKTEEMRAHEKQGEADNTTLECMEMPMCEDFTIFIVVPCRRRQLI